MYLNNENSFNFHRVSFSTLIYISILAPAVEEAKFLRSFISYIAACKSRGTSRSRELWATSPVFSTQSDSC